MFDLTPMGLSSLIGLAPFYPVVPAQGDRKGLSRHAGPGLAAARAKEVCREDPEGIFIPGISRATGATAAPLDRKCATDDDPFSPALRARSHRNPALAIRVALDALVVGRAGRPGEPQRRHSTILLRSDQTTPDPGIVPADTVLPRVQNRPTGPPSLKRGGKACRSLDYPVRSNGDRVRD